MAASTTTTPSSAPPARGRMTAKMSSGMAIMRTRHAIHKRGVPRSLAAGRFASDEPTMSSVAGVVKPPMVESAGPTTGTACTPQNANAMVMSVAMLQGVTKSRQLMRTLTPYSLSDAMSHAPKVNDSRLNTMLYTTAYTTVCGPKIADSTG